MARVHVLEASGQRVRFVFHAPAPAGTNNSGITWKSAFLTTGRSGRTVLPEGTGAGQITTAEKTTVLTGDTLELVVDATVNSTDLAALQAEALEIAQTALAETLDRWQADLKWWGATRT